jgi:hypothetical protein
MGSKRCAAPAISIQNGQGTFLTTRPIVLYHNEPANALVKELNSVCFLEKI